jgi:hypothetical protein
MWTYPAGLPAADGQPAATGWGPHVTVPPEAHTRQAPRPAPAVPRRPQPTATQQPRTRRQVTAALTLTKEVECDRKSAPNLTSRHRQKRSFHGSAPVTTPVTSHVKAPVTPLVWPPVRSALRMSGAR